MVEVTELCLKHLGVRPYPTVPRRTAECENYQMIKSYCAFIAHF